MPATDNPRPVPPIQPDIDDCCNSGCNPCIFDLYQDALERYRADLKIWEEKNNAKNNAKNNPASTPARPARIKKTTKKLGAP